MKSAKQKAASRANLVKARKKKRGGLGNVPARYSGSKDYAVAKAASAQRRGNFLFAKDGNRAGAAHETPRQST